MNPAYSSRGNTRRGGGGGKQNSAPLFTFSRYCIYCGHLILNQAIDKKLRCDNKQCNMPIPARWTPSMRTHWTHCRRCDDWIAAGHFYCSGCGLEIHQDDVKQGFVAAKRQLMSKKPDLVAAGKDVSLATLGGEELLSTPKKTKSSFKAIEFDDQGDELLSNIELPEDMDEQKKKDVESGEGDGGAKAGGDEKNEVPEEGGDEGKRIPKAGDEKGGGDKAKELISNIVANLEKKKKKKKKKNEKK